MMETEKRTRKHPKRDIYMKERESGKTITEIAKIYGVSHQAVAQATARKNGYFKPYAEENCIYKNLRKWLNDNKVTRNEFARRMGLPPIPANSSRVSGYFTGKNHPGKITIDKMLKVTGLTYEELFWKED